MVRHKEYAEDWDSDSGLFWAQVEACGSQVSDTPGKLLRWGVEDAATHDDLLVSAALCALLDRLDWRPPGSHAGGRRRTTDGVRGAGMDVRPYA